MSMHTLQLHMAEFMCGKAPLLTQARQSHEVRSMQAFPDAWKSSLAFDCLAADLTKVCSTACHCFALF